MIMSNLKNAFINLWAVINFFPFFLIKTCFFKLKKSNFPNFDTSKMLGIYRDMIFFFGNSYPYYFLISFQFKKICRYLKAKIGFFKVYVFNYIYERYNFNENLNIFNSICIYYVCGFFILL